MTTTITVKAGHGWPVDVAGIAPETGNRIETYGGRVEAGVTQEFICHSGMDLHIHEVQPDESDKAPNARFPFALKQIVKLSESDEQGTIIGRADYSFMPPQYLVRYRAGDGRQVENWWPADALVAA